MRLALLFFIQVFLFASDFDCIVIGSSPFSLFEALYQKNLGKNVLILEEASECGGAWKSIDICGIRHVDMGCHQIGSDKVLKAFLEEYAGCKIVSMDHPHLPFDETHNSNGWYFSKGCHELIENLLQLINALRIPVHTNERAENITIDSTTQEAVVQTSGQLYRTKKIIATPMSSFQLSATSHPQNRGKTKHYHLYMLIQDPTPFRFTYKGGITSGMSRMMNLTYFANLTGTGRQLIVVQTYNDQYFNQAEKFLDALKMKNLIDQGAYLLEIQTYIYESSFFHQRSLSQDIIEILQTGHIQNLAHYVPKWKQALKPYSEIVRN